MELDRPLRVITTSTDGDVLSVLAAAESGFTVPTVQRLIASRSDEGVRKSLRRLTEQGIVYAERVGQAWTYRLNRDHLAAPAIVALADLRGIFLDRMSAEVAEWSPPAELVVLFGSAARGAMTPASDIDLFVVRPDAVAEDHPSWSRQVHRLQDHASRWTGNDARVLEYGATQAADGTASGSDRVLQDIQRDGIVLGGRLRSLSALDALPAQETPGR